MKKIIKRHSDGSVTTLGEALSATTKGALTGFGVGAVTVLAGIGGVVLYVKLHENQI